MTNQKQAKAFIANRNPFSASAMSGKWLTVGYASRLGQLPDKWRAIWGDDVARCKGRMYVVWSYETPIAWWVEGDDTPVIPDVKYSVTTSRHQAIARAYL